MQGDLEFDEEGDGDEDDDDVGDDVHYGDDNVVGAADCAGVFMALVFDLLLLLDGGGKRTTSIGLDLPIPSDRRADADMRQHTS